MAKPKADQMDHAYIQWEDGCWPNCTTQKRYQNWLESACGYGAENEDNQKRNNATHERAMVSFCRDCTPGYQQKMIESHLCDFPAVRFVWKASPHSEYEECVGTMFGVSGNEIVTESNPPMFRKAAKDMVA